MKRRDFLKNSTLASSLFMVPSFVKAFERVAASELGFKKLVIIQLAGGNDGLNTVVPFQNDIYYKVRPTLAIKKADVLALNDELGLHPSLQPLKKLYDKGYLSIINSVGYPNPVRSHFRSRDIWLTATDSNKFKTSGWLGRYLDNYADSSHSGIELDNKVSLAMKGDEKCGISVPDAFQLYRNTKAPYFKKVLDNHAAEHLSEDNLGYLYQQMIQAKSSATYIYENSKTYSSSVTYPDNAFAKQLKNAATFINSHLNTKIYYTSMGGFDTHAGQKVKQERILKIYADAVSSFIKDLETHGTFDDTLILTFSEFGRRVRENGSKGTDHGAANNLFIIGKHLKKPGVFNKSPNLVDLDNNKDLKFEIDFRNIYATVLTDWLKADASKIISNRFESLGIV